MVNVRMCKCANVQMVAFVHAIDKTLSSVHLYIHTFSDYSHIPQLFAHLHILTFAHFPRICTFPPHLHILTFAHFLWSSVIY